MVFIWHDKSPLTGTVYAVGLGAADWRALCKVTPKQKRDKKQGDHDTIHTAHRLRLNQAQQA